MITTLSQLVAQVESGNVPTALRFEPGYANRWVTPDIVARCIRAHLPAYMNDTTAKTLCSFSWGRYQAMGGLLYELGYKGTLPDFAVNTTLQDAWFETILKAKGIDYSLQEIISDPVKRARLAKRYNGDEVAYSAKLINTFNKFKAA